MCPTKERNCRRERNGRNESITRENLLWGLRPQAPWDLVGIAFPASAFLPIDQNDSFNGSAEATVTIRDEIIHVLSEPFEILRHSNQESYRKEKENAGSGRDLEIWLPRNDQDRKASPEVFTALYKEGRGINRRKLGRS